VSIQSLPEFEDATQRLAPERYLDYLKGVKLLGLALDFAEARARRDIVSGEEELQLKLPPPVHRVEYDGEERADLLVECTVQAVSGRKRAVSIKAVYRVQFASQQELPIEFFAIYARQSAGIQVWPFLRELVYSLTSRMGLPALTLPMQIYPRGAAPAKRKRSGTASSRADRSASSATR
jgi:preprotein translocase subunit SecB